MCREGKVLKPVLALGTELWTGIPHVAALEKPKCYRWIFAKDLQIPAPTPSFNIAVSVGRSIISAAFPFIKKMWHLHRRFH